MTGEGLTAGAGATAEGLAAEGAAERLGCELKLGTTLDRPTPPSGLAPDEGRWNAGARDGAATAWAGKRGVDCGADCTLPAAPAPETLGVKPPRTARELGVDPDSAGELAADVLTAPREGNAPRLSTVGIARPDPRNAEGGEAGTFARRGLFTTSPPFCSCICSRTP